MLIYNVLTSPTALCRILLYFSSLDSGEKLENGEAASSRNIIKNDCR